MAVVDPGLLLEEGVPCSILVALSVGIDWELDQVHIEMVLHLLGGIITLETGLLTSFRVAEIVLVMEDGTHPSLTITLHLLLSIQLAGLCSSCLLKCSNIYCRLDDGLNANSYDIGQGRKPGRGGSAAGAGIHGRGRAGRWIDTQGGSLGEWGPGRRRTTTGFVPQGHPNADMRHKSVITTLAKCYRAFRQHESLIHAPGQVDVLLQM